MLTDLVPIASIARSIGVLVVQPSFPATTIPEFISYLKANPGKVTMASGGVGSAQHLYGALFTSITGLKMLHVPYRGGGPALSDLLGGHVQVMFDTLPTSLELIKAGKLRALGVTSAKRSEVLPNVPAIAEFVPGYEADGWQGVAAPRNTSTEIIAKLNKAINASLAEPAVKNSHCCRRLYHIGHFAPGVAKLCRRLHQEMGKRYSFGWYKGRVTTTRLVHEGSRCRATADAYCHSRHFALWEISRNPRLFAV